jgi:glycosyltransferase involved in cell wall biosynthesis
MDGKNWVERWAKRNRPDLAIYNSRFTAPDLDNIYPGAARRLIYYPVEMKPAPSDPGERDRVRDVLNVPHNDVVIIQVSRMEAWKGHGLHLEALGKLKDVPNWRCWIVGGSQRASEALYVEGLKNKAKGLGIDSRVHFLGQRSDVADLLTAADIFCQPNARPEPFGIVFVEALAAGLPAVATDMGGPKEIIDRNCGVLSAPNDADALAGVLGRLIADTALRKQLGGAGPTRARRLCGPKDRILELQEAVQALLADHLKERAGVVKFSST